MFVIIFISIILCKIMIYHILSYISMFIYLFVCTSIPLCSSNIVLAHGGSGSSDRSFMVRPLSYFLFQPVLYVWCNKVMVCTVLYGMVHI